MKCAPVAFANEWNIPMTMCGCNKRTASTLDATTPGTTSSSQPIRQAVVSTSVRAVSRPDFCRDAAVRRYV